MIDISKNEIELSNITKDFIKRIQKTFHIQLFVIATFQFKSSIDDLGTCNRVRFDNI